jgi:ATP-dependent helicase Lhr and Lhr-like helicase
VWKGIVTNDTFRSLRQFMRGHARPTGRRAREKYAAASRGVQAFRSRREVPPSSDGRWSLVQARLDLNAVTSTERAAALAESLLNRYGLVTRDVAAAESLVGGFTSVYEVMKRMEESGRIRRGYFVSDVGGMQFSLPAAVDLLRALKFPAERAETVTLASSDPANPYGALLPWPEAQQALTRGAGAHVVLVDGELAAYVPKSATKIATFLPEAEPERSRVARAVAGALATLGQSRASGLVVSELDGLFAPSHALAKPLVEAGFSTSPQGFYLRR